MSIWLKIAKWPSHAVFSKGQKSLSLEHLVESSFCRAHWLKWGCWMLSRPKYDQLSARGLRIASQRWLYTE